MKSIFAVAMSAAALSAASLSAGAAAAQTQMPPCAGQYEILRTDTVKPGKMDLFKKAVADHQAWYVAHSLPDKIMLGQILTPKGTAGGPFSETSAMTLHTGASGPAAPPHDNDAAWSAFVAEYNASSDMVSNTIVCVSAAK